MQTDFKDFPRIVVLTVNPWSDKLAFGNTISNQLGGWDSSKIANIYLRDGEIVNNCCKKYFKITEKNLIYSLIKNKAFGSEIAITGDSSSCESNVRSKGASVVNRLKQIRSAYMLFLLELLWIIGFRNTKKLDDFLDQHDPDIIYFGNSHLIYSHRILHYIQKRTKAKVVVLYGDENYSFKSFSPGKYIHQYFLRLWMRKTIFVSCLNYASTPELADYFTKICRKKFKVLYKGVVFNRPISNVVTSPFKIVYAGNLLYGRWQSLALLVRAMEEDEIRGNYILSIYTGTPTTNEMRGKLLSSSSTIHGSISHEKVKTELEVATIVLHVESFEEKDIQFTKYSFSTKITDCIQSGSCIMAIGPAEISSINFLQNSDSALIATNYNEIVYNLKKIIANPDLINYNRNRMYEFAKGTFDLRQVRHNLYTDLLELV